MKASALNIGALAKLRPVERMYFGTMQLSPSQAQQIHDFLLFILER